MVEEVPSGVRAIGGARTSLAAFLVQVARHAEQPALPQRIVSWKQFASYAAITGGSPEGTGQESQVVVSGAMWAAVYGWFANGGGECYLVPVDGNSGVAGALDVLEGIEEITIVVAPDLWSESTAAGSRATAGLIADHCARMGNRVAVLHLPDGDPPESAADTLGIERDEARAFATVYYPWIKVLDVEGEETAVPPTGHVAGVWARVDARRGVHKAPANEDLRGVVGLTRELDDTAQEGLNDQGVNALRKFPGTGHLVWGARTLAATDPADVEHSYLNVRRTVNFIKQSILQSTRWAVFEPNDDRLQTSVTAMVTSFLTGLWRRGMLTGANTEQAFYVVCDESNNPPEDALQGKLNIEVGAALVRPAEFITFKVTQIINQST
ncbi:phage tail sheath subtilisin-like domain-containing protein [Streptomyces sp. NPDC000410]|uniref:phage tail sheath family protein n=1 Tax=Streptomyces sp. NPDC000410 TaxID=3154254 RepID=UPI00332C9392